MGRIFKPLGPIVRDEAGNPVLDEDDKPKREPRTKFWYIRYYDNAGKARDESTHSTKIGVAKALLVEREAAKGRGEPVGAQVGRITLDEAIQAVIADQTMNKRRSIDDTRSRIDNHLTPYFTGRRMTAITTDEITAYIVARQQTGASNGTINRELQILGRAFELAVRARKLTSKPHVPRLKEPKQPRKGFFERTEFDAVRAHLPEYLQPLLTFYYWTGWRHEEVLSLEIRQVDLGAEIVSLDPQQTKTEDGRQFYFGAIDELRDVLTAQVQSAERLTRETGRMVTRVFHRPDGTPVNNFRRAWERARKAAGYPGKQIHDFRRTSARNFERAGVSRTVAMAMIGHKTESMYRRYSIVDEARIREEVEKLRALPSSGQGPATGQVRQFKRAAK